MTTEERKGLRMGDTWTDENGEKHHYTNPRTLAAEGEQAAPVLRDALERIAADGQEFDLEPTAHHARRKMAAIARAAVKDARPCEDHDFQEFATCRKCGTPKPAPQDAPRTLRERVQRIKVLALQHKAHAENMDCPLCEIVGECDAALAAPAQPTGEPPLSADRQETPRTHKTRVHP